MLTSTTIQLPESWIPGVFICLYVVLFYFYQNIYLVLSKNIYHTALLACLITTLGKAQTTLHIADAQNQQPLAGATASHGSTRVVANNGGYIPLPAGTHAWLITAVGYQSQKVTAPSAKDTIPVYLLATSNALQDVVVSGTLKPMRRLDSPIPVESFSQSFLKQNPTPSLFEAMTMVNGIQPQLTCNVCNTGDIRINGMEGPYTMVLIDGMPIVSSLSTVYGLSGIPNSIIKRIEVVKGPASTLYGSEAVGGLINIITKDPLSSSRLAVDINASTLGEYSVDLSTKITSKKATGLLAANGFFFNRQHDINRDNFTDVTLQNRFSLFTKWDIDRRQDLPASIAIRLLTERRWGGELQWQRKFLGGDSVYGESIDTRRVELIGNYGIHKDLVLEYSYNFHFQNSYYGTTWYKGQQHTAFTQLRWSKTMGNHQLLAGIPLRYLWYDDNTPATAKLNANAPSKQLMTALYLQDEWTARKNVTLLTGIRIEHSNIQGAVVAPRLAVKWQPAAHHTIRLSAGNGFRVVNLFTEDHAALSGFREIVIQNDLKPEQSWNANLNYSGDVHTAAGIFGWDASLFYTWFTNKIIPDYDTDPQKIIYDNLDGYAVSKGVSTQFSWTMTNGLRTMAGATYMDVYAVENDVKTLQQYAPRWSGNYSLNFLIRKAGITIDLTGKWTGSMRLPVVPNDFRPAMSPSYNLLNAQLTKKWPGGIETYLAVKNMFNFIPANPILHPDDPFDQRGGLYWNANGTPNSVTNPNAYSFDPSYNYAPMQGTKWLLGFRWNMQ